jgi:hypothetical protein
MLTLSLLSGLWVALMILVLPRVLAHPRALEPIALHARRRPRRPGA